MGAASIRAAIATALTTSGITAIVGTRIYAMPGMPLDPARPYIAWKRGSGSSSPPLLSGGSPQRGTIGLTIECQAKTVADLDTLTDAVMAAVRAFTPNSIIRALDIRSGPTDIAVTSEGYNQLIPAASIDVLAVVRE